MSKSRSVILYLLHRLIPLLIMIGLVGWCTTANRVKRGTASVQTELTQLFMQESVVDNPGADLADAAKTIGEPGMNRLLFQGASTLSLDAIKWLVKHGANPKNVGTMKDLTLLQNAARNSGLERMEYFLSFGLDPMQRNRDLVTVLDIAVQGGSDQRTFALLASKGLKVTDVDAFGRQAIHFATAKAIPWVAAAGANMDALDGEGKTALLYAARDGKNPEVIELLSHGASVFVQDKKGRSALHLAVLGNASSVIDSLLAAGAPKTVRDNDGKTPRDIAADISESRGRIDPSIIDKL